MLSSGKSKIPSQNTSDGDYLLSIYITPTLRFTWITNAIIIFMFPRSFIQFIEYDLTLIVPNISTWNTSSRQFAFVIEHPGGWSSSRNNALTMWYSGHRLYHVYRDRMCSGSPLVK